MPVKKVIYALPVFLLPLFCLAQKVTVTGMVADSLGKPLGFTTVSLLRQGNALQTTYTKEDGKFSFSRIDSGNYVMLFSHAGYDDKRQPLSVKLSGGDMALEKITMQGKSTLLKEVAVITRRPLVEQQDDKVIFNVEDDPTTKSETALDILRKTPFISVDGEDNIQVNGKKNFKVLLNGRETSMFSRNIKEALRGFPGALISKIEVITSPSAKYDGEGIGGLINIITRKKVAGYNGTLNTFLRSIDKLANLNINANAKVGKMGASVFFSAGGTEPVDLASFSTTTPTQPIAYVSRSLQGIRSNSDRWQFGNAELSFELDSLNTISSYANINSGRNRNWVDQEIRTVYSNYSTTSYFDLASRSRNPGISVGTDFIHKFKKIKDREFTFRFLGEFGKNTSYLNSFQDNPGTDRYTINNSVANNDQYTFQADHSLPVKKNDRFESGFKAILRRASSDFESLLKYDPAAAFKRNPGNTDNFKYMQDVFSLYSMYTLRFKKSGLRFGARVEHTSVNGNFITSNTVVKQEYTTLLPNIQFTNRLSPVVTMVFTYTKRLSRPYIWDLNPFVNNNDSLNISYGNPALGPQTIHSVSAQTRFIKGTLFAGINLESNYSGNKILEFTSLEPATGISRTTSLNIGKEFQVNLNMNINAKLSERWNVAANTSLRFSSVNSNASGGQKNHGLGGNFNLNGGYRVNKRFVINTYLGLWKDPVTLQTTYPFSTWYNLAFNHKFLKDKLNVSLRAVNYLEKTRDYRTVIKDPNFTTVNVSAQRRRGLAIALSWNFGKLSENVSRKKGISNDDLYNKPQQSQPNN